MTIRSATNPADTLPPMSLEHVLDRIAHAIHVDDAATLAVLELALTRFGAEITTH